MSTATIENRVTSHELKTVHSAHLLDEGFSPEQIDLWYKEGLIFSVSEDEARSMGFTSFDYESQQQKSGSGLYLGFTHQFGQIRLDTPVKVKEKNGKFKTRKYLSPCGTQSIPMMPERTRAWTEGWKDAQAGSILGGIPTAAAAGISHYKKAFPKEGGGLITIADSDAWWNPDVFAHLVNSGLHQHGKCAIVPLPPGEKAGLVEFFKAGNGAEEYRQLLEEALTPKQILLEWPEKWKDAPEDRRIAMVKKAVRLAGQILNNLERQALVGKIAKNSDFTKSEIQGTISREVAIETKQKGEPSVNPNDREGKYRSACKELGLDPQNCVTSTTFDGYIFRKFGGKKKGESRKWVVLDQSFYKLSEDGSHYQLQDDLEIQRQIAAVGEKAFKLRVGEKGAEATYPYECDKYTKSAFSYARTRLHCQQPNNGHLISFKNGTLDTRTGEFRGHDPRELLTRHIPHDYSPNEQCPGAFSLFIKESFGEEMLPVIRAFTAMFLDPSAPYGRFPHLIGQSGGGKGTLGRFWNSLYGENGSGSACSFEELATAEKRHQNLTGKSIWGIADIGGYVSGLRAFYELVDNGEMSGRALYSANGYNKRWGTRFWVASVDHLQIENAGDGWKRRAYPIPVRNRALKPDPFLRQALEDCKAAVISWALAMPKEERDEILLGKPSIDIVKNAIREAELYSDSVRTFVDLTLRPCPGANIDNVEMHSIYVAFCKQFGYSPSNFNKFVSHLKTVLPQNRVERRREKKRDGRWGWAAPYWGSLTHLGGVYGDISQQPDPSTGYQTTFGGSEPQWICHKSKALEGGLDKFEEFWANKVEDGGTKTQQGVEPFGNPPDNSEGLDPPEDGGTKAQQGFAPPETALVHPQNNSYVTQRTASRTSCHDQTETVSPTSYTFVHHQNKTFFGGGIFSQEAGAKNFSSGESLDLVVYEPVRGDDDTQELEIADAVGTLVELANTADIEWQVFEAVLSPFSIEEKEEIRQRLPEGVRVSLAAICRGETVESPELSNEPIDREVEEEVVEELPEVIKPVESEIPVVSLIPRREIKFDPTNWNGFPWERETGWMPGEERQRTRQRKSEELRDKLLEVRTQDDFDAILMKWGRACIAWVDGNLLTPEEVASRNSRIQASREFEQQSLL